jgi:hypothetical protein
VSNSKVENVVNEPMKPTPERQPHGLRIRDRLARGQRRQHAEQERAADVDDEDSQREAGIGVHADPSGNQ